MPQSVQACLVYCLLMDAEKLQRKGGMICLLEEHQSRTDRLYLKIVSWVRVSHGDSVGGGGTQYPAFRQVANQNSFSQSYAITFHSSWKFSASAVVFVKIWGFIFQGALHHEKFWVHITVVGTIPFSIGSHTLLVPENTEHVRKLDIRYVIILSWFY